MKLILIIGTFLILFYSGCSIVELNIVSPPGQDKMIKDCDGLKLELFIQQDSVGMSSYYGEVKDGIINFSITDPNTFDFNKKVKMKLVVIKESQNLSCAYKFNSFYTTDTVKLKVVSNRKDSYEIEINKFRKIY